MTYSRFEDLPVWKAAAKLYSEVIQLTSAAEISFRRCAGLRAQLERASLSVSNNIAEGFERGTTNELLSFIYIARGSAGEVRSMLAIMDGLPSFQDFKSQISNLKSLAEGCSRQLRGWAEKLQESEIKGQRHLTKASKAEFESSQEAERMKKAKEEFLREIREDLKRERGF